MIDAAYILCMARYNRWQNESLYRVADGLTDDARRLMRGAFFGSIHRTLNHILWGDMIWMSRFAKTDKPQAGMSGSAELHAEWRDLVAARKAFDDTIENWAEKLDPSWPEGNLTWFSVITQTERSMPRWVLVTNMFNHQTHHRGQVHAMLTQAGGKPDDTDLMLMTNIPYL